MERDVMIGDIRGRGEKKEGDNYRETSWAQVFIYKQHKVT